MDNDLPTIILTHIGIYLKVADLVNFRLTNKRINKVFDNNYYWMMKLKDDFGVDSTYDDALDIYKKIYQGLLIVYDDELIPVEKLKQRKRWYTKFGLIAIINHICDGNWERQYYMDNWTSSYDFWIDKIDKNFDIKNITDQAIYGYVRYFEGKRYYIAPNRLLQWHKKFQIGQSFDMWSENNMKKLDDPFVLYIRV